MRDKAFYLPGAMVNTASASAAISGCGGMRGGEGEHGSEFTVDKRLGSIILDSRDKGCEKMDEFAHEGMTKAASYLQYEAAAAAVAATTAAQWNLVAPPLSLWCHNSCVEAMKAIARREGHLEGKFEDGGEWGDVPWHVLGGEENEEGKGGKANGEGDKEDQGEGRRGGLCMDVSVDGKTKESEKEHVKYGARDDVSCVPKREPGSVRDRREWQRSEERLCGKSEQSRFRKERDDRPSKEVRRWRNASVGDMVEGIMGKEKAGECTTYEKGHVRERDMAWKERRDPKRVEGIRRGNSQERREDDSARESKHRHGERREGVEGKVVGITLPSKDMSHKRGHGRPVERGEPRDRRSVDERLHANRDLERCAYVDKEVNKASISFDREYKEGWNEKEAKRSVNDYGKGRPSHSEKQEIGAADNSSEGVADQSKVHRNVAREHVENNTTWLMPPINAPRLPFERLLDYTSCETHVVDDNTKWRHGDEQRRQLGAEARRATEDEIVADHPASTPPSPTPSSSSYFKNLPTEALRDPPIAMNLSLLFQVTMDDINRNPELREVERSGRGREERSGFS